MIVERPLTPSASPEGNPTFETIIEVIASIELKLHAKAGQGETTQTSAGGESPG